MKKKIVKALLVLFLLYTIGGIFAIFSLRQINSDLNKLIGLHRVEIIRQDLVINVQNVQGNLFTVGTRYGRELDQIVQNVTDLDTAIDRCGGCHHQESIAGRISEVKRLTEQYKAELSSFITVTANEQRLQKIKRTAAGIGEQILDQTREMTFIANQSLQQKTRDAVSKVVRIENLLIATILFTMFIGVVVAASLTKTVIRPIEHLVNAAHEIKRGNLGYTTDFRDETEFGDLARTFNEMSNSLRESHEKIVSYTNRLSGLLRSTSSLYSAGDSRRLIAETAASIGGLVEAEQVGVIILDRKAGISCHMVPPLDGEQFCMDERTVRSLFEHANRRAVIINDAEGQAPPFGEYDLRMGTRNVMVVWLRHQGELMGAIRVANKPGEFSVEDLRLLSILANNFSTAMDNLSLYEDLKRKMQELREAQQQLIQAAKLAAIGELASSVAHEINNPLTSILGYAELMKEEKDLDSVHRDLSIIEQESLRARGIVRQLLEFARKKPLELRATDLTDLVRDVMKLGTVNIKSTEIQVVERYRQVPEIMADRNQLKQVFLNIITNAVHAMGDAGTLTVETGIRGDEVYASFSDTGGGIDEEHRLRIFEPFFTTKQDTGTGLGLSISYKIVSAHDGRIDVESRQGEGSTFTVVLPVRKAVSHVSL